MPGQRHCYATPAEVWAELDAESGANAQPGWLLSVCEAAAQRIDRFCRRHFVTEYGEKRINRGPDPQRLWLPADLLSIERFEVGRAAPRLWTEGVEFFAGPLNRLPRKWLYAAEGYSFREAPEAVAAYSVTGWWGYSDEREPLGALGASLDGSAVSFPIAGSADLPGVLLAVGGERMYVSGATGDEVTVERGVLGTAASAHDSGAEVERVLPPPAIRSAAIALTARAHKQAQSAYTDIAGISVTGEIAFGKALPADVRLDLESFRRTR